MAVAAAKAGIWRAEPDANEAPASAGPWSAPAGSPVLSQRLARSERDKRDRREHRLSVARQQNQALRAAARRLLFRHVDRVFSTHRHLRSAKRFDRIVDGVAGQGLPPPLHWAAQLAADVARIMHAAETRRTLDSPLGLAGNEITTSMTAEQIVSKVDPGTISYVYGPLAAELFTR